MQAFNSNRMDLLQARARVWGVVVLVALAAACAPVAAPKVPPDGRPMKRIVFVGDSFVHRSARDHDLLGAIHDELATRHPAYNLDLVDAGVNGNRIADIQGRLDRDVIALRPHAIVLYWDSDISDVNERSMTPAEVREVRTAYERTLRDVASRLVATGAFVIMSGPTLIGERPRGRNPKDSQLDAYRRINRRVASAFGIRYIDTRRAFFAHRPPDMPADVSKGILTEDGEHFNEPGARLIQSLFVDGLDGWLQRLPKPTKNP